MREMFKKPNKEYSPFEKTEEQRELEEIKTELTKLKLELKRTRELFLLPEYDVNDEELFIQEAENVGVGLMKTIIVKYISQDVDVKKFRVGATVYKKVPNNGYETGYSIYEREGRYV